MTRALHGFAVGGQEIGHVENSAAINGADYTRTPLLCPLWHRVKKLKTRDHVSSPWLKISPTVWASLDNHCMDSYRFFRGLV